MNNFALFLDSYKNKETNYKDLVNILHISHIDYNINFNNKSNFQSYEVWQKNI